MSEATSTRCGCRTMIHPRWQEFRDSSEYEAAHCQSHIDWDWAKSQHEAHCDKLISTTNRVAEREGDKIRIYVPEPNEANTLEVVLDLDWAFALMVDLGEALDNWQPVEEGVQA